MSRPLLLDLYSGAGGAAKGYWLAGFDVVGVDHVYQPDYPYPFEHDDAIRRAEKILDMGVSCGRGCGNPHEVVAIHASPPCQHHSALAKGNNANQHEYPELIAATRELLEASGLPWVIENVVGAPLRNPVTLCGEMFGLGVIRHRLFETNWLLMQPEHVPHRGRVSGCRHGEWFEGPYFQVYGNGGGKGSLREWQAAMGIDWVSTKKSLSQCIPPAYSEWIGRQLMEVV